MIFSDRGIDDSTMLRLIAKILRGNTDKVKGFKVKTFNGVALLPYEDVIQFAETLATEMAEGNYEKLQRCETCGNFSYPGKKGAPGWCTPKNYDHTKNTTDYCSGWTPMTEQQEYTRRKVNELGPLQTQRAGDGSEDSTERDRPAPGTKAKRRSGS